MVVARLIMDLQKATFAHLMRSDYARLSRDTTGQMVSRLTNDLTFIQNAAQTSIIASIKDGLSVIALLATLAMVFRGQLHWGVLLLSVPHFVLGLAAARGIAGMTPGPCPWCERARAVGRRGMAQSRANVWESLTAVERAVARLARVMVTGPP